MQKHIWKKTVNEAKKCKGNAPNNNEEMKEGKYIGNESIPLEYEKNYEEASAAENRRKTSVFEVTFCCWKTG